MLSRAKPEFFHRLTRASIPEIAYRLKQHLTDYFLKYALKVNKIPLRIPEIDFSDVALDTTAGTVKRAPQIWQRCSAEWLYRLIVQPSRIKRQKVLPLFAAAVLTAKLRQLLSGRS